MTAQVLNAQGHIAMTAMTVKAYVQEETMKRRAAEANGEFDRQAAIAKIDYEA